MRARFIPARYEDRAGVDDRAHRRQDPPGARDRGLITIRSDQDEVVIHHAPSTMASAIVHEATFRPGCVHQRDVGQAHQICGFSLRKKHKCEYNRNINKQ